jgi:hypothetical protein
VDGNNNIVPLCLALLDSESKDNVRWVLEEIVKSARATPEDGLLEWLQSRIAHFMDRGPGWLVVDQVFPSHERMYVLVVFVFLARF